MIKNFSTKKLMACYRVFFALLIIIAAADASAAFKYASVGMDAHDFSGNDIVTGNSISIGELHRDNLVIVVFWATWSPRSIEQLKDMNKLKAEFSGEAIEIVAVNVDAPKISAATQAQITETISTLDLKFPVIIDQDLKIFYTYGVIAVPSTAIIDTTGTVRYDPSGYGMIIKDIIADSVKAYLGLVPATLQDTLPRGYQPQKKSARYYNLALNLKQSGMYDRALENLELAHQADTLFAAPLTLMGEIMLKQGKLDEAKAAYSQAAILDSTGVTIWAGWGRVLLQGGENEAAREKLDRALLIDSTFTPALIDFGLCLAREDRINEAIESLLQAADLNRGDPMIQYYLGQIYKLSGKDSEAAQAFLKALSILFPDD
jgi:peroxiredoxin/Tfp pilus assembly protein PilF